EVRIGEGTPVEPGGIRGSIDLRFENERPNETTVHANYGPFNDSGSTRLPPGYGQFQIDNLIPSSAVPGGDTYEVHGQMYFPVPPAGEVQYFRTPNVEVTVPAGGYAYLNNTFIMEAGYLQGDVRVEGPDDCVNRFVEP